jgi:hypothetical protein
MKLLNHILPGKHGTKLWRGLVCLLALFSFLSSFIGNFPAAVHDLGNVSI